MAFIDSLGAIFEKLIVPKIASVAASASLLLLVVSAGLIVFQINPHLETTDLSAKKIQAAVTSFASPTLTSAAAVFFIIFVTGCCSLIIEFVTASVRLLKESLRKLVERLDRDIKSLERLQKRHPGKLEDEDLKELLKYARVISPYLLISFDLIFYIVFYICLVLVALIIILAILAALVLSAILPYVMGILLVFVIGWVLFSIAAGGLKRAAGLIRGAKKKRAVNKWRQ
jgi:hypothetical protein